jgi:hypothetical protein
MLPRAVRQARRRCARDATRCNAASAEASTAAVGRDDESAASTYPMYTPRRATGGKGGGGHTGPGQRNNNNKPAGFDEVTARARTRKRDAERKAATRLVVSEPLGVHGAAANHYFFHLELAVVGAVRGVQDAPEGEGAGVGAEGEGAARELGREHGHVGVGQVQGRLSAVRFGVERGAQGDKPSGVCREGGR